MTQLGERLDERLLSSVLDAALQGGADFAEVYAEERRGRALRLEDQRVEELTSGLDRGAGIRVISGERTGYAYTNRFDRDSLLEAARVAAASAVGGGEKTAADLGRPDRRIEHPVRKDPLDATKAELVALATTADDGARAAGDEIVQVVVSYADVVQDVLVANSDGRLADDHRTRTKIAVQVVAARDGNIQTGYDVVGTSGGHELFDQSAPADVAGTAARRALTLLDAEPAPSGEMPVVLWRGSGGVLFHEACGHGLEGDFIARDSSVYAGRIGDRIGSPLVNGVDDATVQNGWGSFAFDDEGTPAGRTVLFEGGVLTGYLTDRRSAHKLTRAGSGNGRRESYAHLPVPRMTNTFILPGESKPDDVLGDVSRGVLCKQLGGGQVNETTGEFVFGMTEAYLVEDGRIVHPIRGANLVGNGPDALNDIDAVCNDLALQPGTCGKNGQWVPAGVGTPTIRIARITVGGTG